MNGVSVWFDVEHRLKSGASGPPPPLVGAPPATDVVKPTTNEQLTGDRYLVARASSSLGIKRVLFRITGGGQTLVANARPFQYGWLGNWDTTTVANGTYTVESVAYGVTGQVTTSAGVVVHVRN